MEPHEKPHEKLRTNNDEINSKLLSTVFFTVCSFVPKQQTAKVLDL